MSTPTERPILFSGSMAQAILAGRKTVTRRLVDPLMFVETTIGGEPNRAIDQRHPDFGKAATTWAPSPYGQPGNRLWVRETLKRGKMPNLLTGGDTNADAAFYAADGEPVLFGGFDAAWTWKRAVLPSIHMPRWASRLVLDVVSVRVERLQDISDEDARAEGAMEWALETEARQDAWAMWTKLLNASARVGSPRGAFAALWASINGAESWDANSWVWRVEFRRAQP